MIPKSVTIPGIILPENAKSLSIVEVVGHVTPRTDYTSASFGSPLEAHCLLIRNLLP